MFLCGVAGEILLEICMHEVLSGAANLIAFHGSYKTSKQHFALVLDMYDKSLEAWLYKTGHYTLKQLEKNSCTKAECAHWIHQRAIVTQGLLSGMAHMHGLKRPVLHRDIKPANVLINISGRGREGVVTSVVLTDFGFACVENSDDNMPGTVWHTPQRLRPSFH